MTLDYEEISRENVLRYGTEIHRIGKMLLADRYDDRTHFLLELLQNAEDAIGRRNDQSRPRSVAFELTPQALYFSHFGHAFDEQDVRGICGIGEGTKADELTAIGRFGIGFKAVYGVTDSPEVHSGEENFAIDSYVLPRAVEPRDTRVGETVFVFPLRVGRQPAYDDVAAGLGRLGARTLLFLREIEEIRWAAQDETEGLYFRGAPDMVGSAARRVQLLGHRTGEEDVEESWIVFSREVDTDEGNHAGHVEVAFKLGGGTTDGEAIESATNSSLVVFFPTIVPTHCGFLLQGPYRTTPSRDNVPYDDPWNKHLVRTTCGLVTDALEGLREMGLLNAEALRVLPLDRSRFGAGSLLSPLFETVRDGFFSRPLLPRHGGGHLVAGESRLARSRELRELANPEQLSGVLGEGENVAWLSGDITEALTPELRQYLMRELGITEIDPTDFVRAVEGSFLEAQSDDWICRFYEFLRGQAALTRAAWLKEKPLIRLEDGRHVPVWDEGQPMAFLPGQLETGFPTVKRSICLDQNATAFLKDLGLTEPDPVDVVIRNVLPRYGGENPVPNDDYVRDLRRILDAFRSDSKSQRAKLLSGLRGARFVRALDAGIGERCLALPGEVYASSGNMRELFTGVESVLLIDDSIELLRDPETVNMLEECGVAHELRLVPIETVFGYEERLAMRRQSGEARISGQERVEDWTLSGLEALLAKLLLLAPAEAATRSARLWEALCDVEEHRGGGAFVGTYSWDYYRRRAWPFDARFIRILNESAWVPDGNGVLRLPVDIAFESLGLGWKENADLRTKIRFRPSAIDALAKEAGIETGVLDFLRKHGLTQLSDLEALLGIERAESGGSPDVGEVPNALPVSEGAPRPQVDKGVVAAGSEALPSDSGKPVAGAEGPRSPGKGSSAGHREFISYLAVHPREEATDPDGLAQAARMALEAEAIEFILAHEPLWRRTPANNPGYDLYQADQRGDPWQWCEVKAMAGTLSDRPVGLSRAQFECAQERGKYYWLYIVECAGDEVPRILRIQDPVGTAKTFTFDSGWKELATAPIDLE